MKYPEIIDKNNWDDYDFEEFNQSDSYQEDYEKALEYQKKNGGELYTMHDDEGSYVCYAKGKHFVDRLGYSIIKLIGDGNGTI